MARSRKAAAGHPPAGRDKERLYTLEVFLLSGPVTEKFAQKNRQPPTERAVTGAHAVYAVPWLVRQPFL
jgi:hypothetical protein